MKLFSFGKKAEAKALRPMMRRGYAAAKTDRLLSDFLAQSKGINDELKSDLHKMRDRCREAERNNPYVKRYLQTLQTNVIGANGITLQIRARNPDGRLDKLANDSIETEFWRWAKKGCTLDGKMTFKDCQNLVIRTLARDGEILVMKVFDKNLPYGFGLQFLEADYLDVSHNVKLSNGNRICMGVEITPYGQPVAYHLFESHPYENGGGGQSRKRMRVPADKILHIFETERAGQLRGVPRLANVLVRLHMLNGYEEAEVVAARAAASKMAFIIQPEDSSGEYTGDDIDNGDVVVDLSPGTSEVLPPGFDIKQFDPQHPVSQYGEFVKSALRGVASGLGISYVTLASDLEGVNYSSIRQGALEDRDHFRDTQRFIIDHFIEPVFNAWLFAAMTKGVIRSAMPAGRPLPIETYDKFAEAAIFRPRGWSWIDPEKEINAHIKSVNNKFSTRQDVIESSGRDVEEVYQQIKAEEELAAEYNINTEIIQ